MACRGVGGNRGDVQLKVARSFGNHRNRFGAVRSVHRIDHQESFPGGVEHLYEDVDSLLQRDYVKELANRGVNLVRVFFAAAHLALDGLAEFQERGFAGWLPGRR